MIHKKYKGNKHLTKDQNKFTKDLQIFKRISVKKHKFGIKMQKY